MNATETLRQDLVDEMNRLIDLSTELRQAMLERDPDKILAVVARGETMGLSPTLMAAPPEVLEDEYVGALARHLRRLQESNRLLATSFQKLYRQILRPTRVGDSSLYGRSGLVQEPASSPLLIRQIG